MSEPNVAMTGTQRAALLLMTLGEAEAAEVLKYMDAGEVQQLGTAMTTLRDVSKDQASSVLDGFITDIEDQTSFGIATEDYVRKVLSNAFSKSKAKSLMERMLTGKDATGFEALKWMSAENIIEIIDGEHPQIVAIILSYLEPDQAANALNALPEELRAEVIMRIAKLSDVQQSALAEIEALIASKSEESSSSTSRKVGGTEVAAAIVNAMGMTSGDTILGEIKEANAELGEEIQEMMFVFDTLLNVDDRGIQSLLREISNDLLVVALKGAVPELQDKIIDNMSKRAATLLREDMEASGPTKLSDVEQAQKEILEVARRLAESGDLDLGLSGEEYV